MLANTVLRFSAGLQAPCSGLTSFSSASLTYPGPDTDCLTIAKMLPMALTRGSAGWVCSSCLGRHVQDVETDAAPCVNIWVIDGSLEADVRWLKGIASRDFYRYAEDPFLVHSASGTLHAAL